MDEQRDPHRRGRRSEDGAGDAGDNPVAAALTAEQYAALVGVLARLARSAADAEVRRRAGSGRPEDREKLSS